MTAAAKSREDGPDGWAPGLRLRIKTLGIKSVRRAVTHADVLPICLAHNLRSGNEGHRHRSRIDPSRTPLNVVMRGPASPAVAAEVAQSVFGELGIVPARRDAIVGIEAVFQAPDGADTPEFWRECMNWVDGRYEHVLSGVIHRDQVRPHMHVIVLALSGGKLAGNALTSGSNRAPEQIRDFTEHMRTRLGLRVGRPVKTLADLAVSTGKGAKTRAAADRRDAKLMRDVGAEWKREPLGQGVDGLGGSCLEAGNPLAHEKSGPPLLRSVSPPSAGVLAHRRPAPKTADFWRGRRPPAAIELPSRSPFLFA